MTAPKVVASTLLGEVVSELEGSADSTGNARPLPRAKIDRWIAADDIDVLGATYALLTDASQVARITPPLETEEVSKFLQKYFLRCFSEDPKSEWADSRYSAGWDIARLLSAWWRDGNISRDVLGDWKRWLADAYLSGDQDTRLCIETATLEHLFEVQGLRDFFSDWLCVPDLAAAYRRSETGPAGFLDEPTDESE